MVPMTSSASAPGQVISGMRSAAVMAWTSSSESSISSGAFSRCALYSPYSSWRRLRPGASNTTAMCVGCSSSMILTSELV